jgi:cation diffusion facilitator family transporter
MAKKSSTAVVYAALAGNLLVAALKYGAAGLSGSSAMLTEAIHSTADCLNQVLLLIGNHRSRLPADDRHDFGYHGEVYFWTFVVAVVVLVVGGGASILQGVQRVLQPEPMTRPMLNICVLVGSALFEGASFVFGYRAFRRVVVSHPAGDQNVSLWRFIVLTKDPNMYESLLEDSAALIGIAVAFLGVIGSGYFHVAWMDGASSILIGLLLIGVALVIAEATRSLIAGEAVAPVVRAEIEQALAKTGFGGAYRELKTLHLGPETILVTMTVPASSAGGPSVERRLSKIRQCLLSADSRIQYVFFNLA